MAELTVLVTMVPRLGHDTQVLGAVLELLSIARRDTGCLRCEVHRSVANPRALLLLETWEHAHAHSLHMMSPAASDYRKRVEGRLESLDMKMLKLIG